LRIENLVEFELGFHRKQSLKKTDRKPFISAAFPHKNRLQDETNIRGAEKNRPDIQGGFYTTGNCF